MLHVIGDIHGQFEKLQTLLSKQKLVSEQGDWIGEKQDKLLFIGDFFDRGKGGIEALDLAMHLNEQNHAEIILGNHECFILGVLFFPDFIIKDLEVTMKQHWLNIGGNEPDLDRITDKHISFLLNSPFMLKKGDTLFTHADSTLYLNYGSSVEEVNRQLSKLLYAKKADQYAFIIEAFADRLSFYHHEKTLEDFLDTYGAKNLVHGHTPIQLISDVCHDKPFHYGSAVNVDGGMYLGGNGFIYSIDV